MVICRRSMLGLMDMVSFHVLDVQHASRRIKSSLEASVILSHPCFGGYNKSIHHLDRMFDGSHVEQAQMPRFPLWRH
jgi:hypothetical protein